MKLELIPKGTATYLLQEEKLWLSKVKENRVEFQKQLLDEENMISITFNIKMVNKINTIQCQIMLLNTMSMIPRQATIMAMQKLAKEPELKEG